MYTTLETAFLDCGLRTSQACVLMLIHLSWEVFVTNGSIVNVNLQACTSLGYKREDLLSLQLRNVSLMFQREKSMPKQRLLIEPSDFERMRVFQQPISILLHGEIIGDNVIIQSHNDEFVLSTTGERYVKANCQFFSNKR
jgi:PAS domain-containing protein